MKIELIYAPSVGMYYMDIDGSCSPIWHGDDSAETQALARDEAKRRLLVLDPDFDVSAVDGIAFTPSV